MRNGHQQRGVVLALAIIALGGLSAAPGQRAGQPDVPPAVSPAGKGAPPPAGDVAAVEAFKNFLSSPPIVESLVFSERQPPDPKAPWRTDVPLNSSQAFRYYEVRWQPGAYLLREFDAPGALSDLHTAGRLAARFNDQCWFHFGRGYHTEIVQTGAGATNRVCQAAYLNSDVLRQVLTLGLMHSEVGSVEWRGNRFRVRQPTRDVRIAGELAPSASGLADSLRVTYTDKSGDINWVIRYDYGNAPAAGALPSTIRCFWLDRDREVERSEFVIQSLRTPPAPLGAEAFLDAGLLRSNTWQVRVYSNEAVYVVLPDKTLKMVERLGRQVVPRRLPGQPGVAKLAAVYTVWAGVNVWIFILGVRMSVRARQEPKMTQRKDL